MIDLAHIHPMLVHFPLALLPVALVLQGIALARGQGLFERECLSTTGLAILMVAAAGAGIAAIFGDIALDIAVSAGFAPSQLEGHEELGMTSALLLIALASLEGALYWRRASSRLASWGMLVAGAALFALLVVTAAFGGHLVYGLGVNVAGVR
jgi:uncharacterized membrane protein